MKKKFNKKKLNPMGIEIVSLRSKGNVLTTWATDAHKNIGVNKHLMSYLYQKKSHVEYVFLCGFVYTRKYFVIQIWNAKQLSPLLWYIETVLNMS